MFMENTTPRFECGRVHQAFIWESFYFWLLLLNLVLFLVVLIALLHSAFNPAKYAQSGAEMKNTLLAFLDYIHGHIPEGNNGAYSLLSHQIYDQINLIMGLRR